MPATIRHLAREGAVWSFTFGAGEGETFPDVLMRFKEGVPLAERTWDAKRIRWLVAATPQNEARLAALFGNFTSLLAAERSQMALFHGGNPWT